MHRLDQRCGPPPLLSSPRHRGLHGGLSRPPVGWKSQGPDLWIILDGRSARHVHSLGVRASQRVRKWYLFLPKS